MSPALTERSLSDMATKEDDSMSFLQKFLPPSFFTAKVVANRTAAPAVQKNPLPEPKQYSQPVKRRLTFSTTTHVLLHMDKNDRSFYFKCPQNYTRLPVEREALLTAISVAHGADWVRIKLGTEVYKLDRAELVAALHALES